MDTPYDLAVLNPWTSPARPAKRQLSGFIPVGPSAFSVIPPPGNPVGVFRSVIQKIYENTPLTAVLPPASSSPPPPPPPPPPSVIIAYVSQTIGSGTAAAPAFTVTSSGDVPYQLVFMLYYSTTTVDPATPPPGVDWVLANPGGDIITPTGTNTFTFTGATIVGRYYRFIASTQSPSPPGTIYSNTQSPASLLCGPLTPPVATLTTQGFAGTRGSTSSQPFWNWTFTGGTPTSQTWTVRQGANTPNVVLATGTTLINSYTWTGATIQDRNYRMTVTVANSAGTGTGFQATQQNLGSGSIAFISQTIATGFPSITVSTSSAFSTRLTFRTWESVSSTDPGTAPPGTGWQLAGSTIIVPTGPTTTFTYSGLMVTNRYYRMQVILTGGGSPFPTYGSVGSPSSMLNTTQPIATGGVITTANGYRIHTFDSSGTFTLTSPAQLSIQYAIVGGGGGGGFSAAAGGGAGGGIAFESGYLIASGSYPIVVGTQGSGGSLAGSAQNGTLSSFDGIEAQGGGGGGTLAMPGGADGGCGGGGCSGGGLGGQGIFNPPVYGFSGGDGSSVGDPAGGGGGGSAQTQGGNANIRGVTDPSGGNGANSFDLFIGGLSFPLGGGGGGGSAVEGGAAGTGGGRGGDPTTAGGAGFDALPYTGGGGGGGGTVNSSGGNGGSGVVLIAYEY